MLLSAPGDMTAEITALRIDVADLLSKPAGRRTVHLEVPVEGLAGSAARVPADEPVELDLVLERVPEGIVVRGSVAARWHAACSVCLTDLEESLVLDVSELFEPDPVEGDTYPLRGHQLDLEQLVRDTVLLDLPLAPTCVTIGRAPCSSGQSDGAPTSGADEEEPPAPDPRWAALSELDL
jgi:uncharacterized protein